MADADADRRRRGRAPPDFHAAMRITTMRRIPLSVVVVLPLLVAPLGAQQPRTVEFSRQLRDSQPLQVRVEQVSGRLSLQPAESAQLYQLQLAYDPRHAEVVHEFDASAGMLRLGTRRVGREWSGRGEAPTMRLDLARTVPLDLRIDMGAAEAALELGGLRLSRLQVASGASDAALRFAAPNAQPMELLEVDVGAASLRATGLGNSRAREMRIRVGIGSAELDFSGEWEPESELELDLSVQLGRTTLRVPDEIGVRLDLSRVAASFELPGFTRRDDAWYSDNWDTSSQRLVVRGRTTLGRVVVERGG